MRGLNTDALAEALRQIAALTEASESDAFVMLDTVRDIERIAGAAIRSFNARNFPGRKRPAFSSSRPKRLLWRWPPWRQHGFSKGHKIEYIISLCSLFSAHISSR